MTPSFVAITPPVLQGMSIMARSRKKNPYSPVTCAESEAWDKKFWHRRFRLACKRAIEQGAEPMPHFREVSQVWGFEKDGHHRFDANAHPEWLRK